MKKIILICVILVISLLFVGTAQGKRGMATLHFYLDVNGNNNFDKNEPSPPWFIICLRTEHTHLGANANRLKFIGSSGDAIFRFIPYPAVYKVTARCQDNYQGIGTEYWWYEGNVNLTGDVFGTRIDLPVQFVFVPIETFRG